MIKITKIGILLRELRGNRSLRDIQKISGVSYTYLRSIEKGVDPRSGNKIIPTPQTLKKLADAYNYPYHDLLKVAGHIQIHPMNSEIIKLLYKLTRNGKFKEAFKSDIFHLFEGSIFTGPYNDFNKFYKQYLQEKKEDPNYVNEELEAEFEEIYNFSNVVNAVEESTDDVWRRNIEISLLNLLQNSNWALEKDEKSEKQIMDLLTLLDSYELEYKGLRLSTKDKTLLRLYLDTLFADRSEEDNNG